MCLFRKRRNPEIPLKSLSYTELVDLYERVRRELSDRISKMPVMKSSCEFYKQHKQNDVSN